MHKHASTHTHTLNQHREASSVSCHSISMFIVSITADSYPGPMAMDLVICCHKYSYGGTKDAPPSSTPEPLAQMAGDSMHLVTAHPGLRAAGKVGVLGSGDDWDSSVEELGWNGSESWWHWILKPFLSLDPSPESFLSPLSTTTYSIKKADGFKETHWQPGSLWRRK